jgi:hypothetical protein
MDPLDLILVKLTYAWDAIAQYFENPMAMFVFAALSLVFAWSLINQKR